MTDLERALEQLAVARRKNSKGLSWSEARRAAEMAPGVEVYADDSGRWPDLERLEADIKAALDDTPIIVTRHAGLIAWLAQRGITGHVIAQATVADVRGKRVYGVLPLHLAAEAAEVVTVDMPLLKPEQRGVDLTPAQMDEAGASMSTYQVLRK